jgi:hypothetical protein
MRRERCRYAKVIPVALNVSFVLSPAATRGFFIYDQAYEFLGPT